MTIKIDAPRAYVSTSESGFISGFIQWDKGGFATCAARIVRESDWRRVMAVVREADWCVRNIRGATDGVLENAVVALRKHLEKRK